MNKVPIIRKNSYKDYLNTSIPGGFFAGLIFGFIALINTNSFTYFLGVGGITWFLIILIYMLIGFPGEEYFKRKKRIAKLQSEKYEFLHANHFELHEDLYFHGKFNEYYFQVFPTTKWIKKGVSLDFDIIQAFYDFDNDRFGNKENEQDLSGEYYLGNLDFKNKTVTYLPRDWETPDFKENLQGLTSILKREKLMPIEIGTWENEIGNKLKKEKEEEEESRTVHLIKIGKLLDIKYIKPEKLAAGK